MRIPPDAIIGEAQFTHYLLAPRPWSWTDLLAAVRRLADTIDAVEDRTDDYGTFYRVSGMIEGPTGTLSVVCIWMQQSVDGAFRFITLKPAKGRSADVSTTV